MAGNSNSGRRSDATKEKYKEILESSGAYSRFKQVLEKTQNEQNFLKAFEMAEDRASGKAPQRNDNYNHDESDRPTAEVLIETIRVLREELASLREGTSVDKST